MKFRRLLRMLWQKRWIPCLLAVLGGAYAVLSADRTPRYVATGKYVLEGFVGGFPKHRDPDCEAMNRDARLQIFESAVVAQRARQRVRELHPDLGETEVWTKVTIPKNSGVAVVSAIGAEPKYTKIYLDAVLDEAMSVRQEMMEQTPEAIAARNLVEDVLTREESIKNQEQALAALEKEYHDPLQVVTRDRLAARAFDAKVEVKTQELAGETDQRVHEARQNLTEAEKRVEVFDEQQSALAKMSDQLTLDRAEYQVQKKKLDALEKPRLTICNVGVMERPTVALPYNPLPSEALMAGASGFGMGLLMMLASALMAALAPTRELAEVW